MKFQYLLYKVEDRISYITLNRPDKRNALNETFVSELQTAFKQATDDKNIKVIILNANGDVFSAGADLAHLQHLQQNSFEENLKDSNHLMELLLQIYHCPKAVIAQLEGHAIAGGCGLATVCDFIFAVPETLMGYTEVKIGFIPAIVMVFLIRKIGEAKTKELLLTGNLINAEKAYGMGIINQIKDKNSIQQEVKKFAKSICTGVSSEAYQSSKELMIAIQEMPLQEGLKYAAKQNALSRNSADCKKGIQAFLNKEKISW